MAWSFSLSLSTMSFSLTFLPVLKVTARTTAFSSTLIRTIRPRSPGSSSMAMLEKKPVDHRTRKSLRKRSAS